jgi:hypothetical protein
MKKNNKIWKKVSLMTLLAVTTTFGLLLSCEKENFTTPENAVQKAADNSKMPLDLYPPFGVCGNIIKKDIVVGDRKDIGDVYFFNDTKFMYVHAIADERNLLKSAYLFTGTREEIPEVNGDLNYGLFTHTIEALTFSSSRHFKIPVRDLKGKFLVSLMVEAKPKYAQGAGSVYKGWADGYKYGVNEIGRIFTYVKGVCLYTDHDEITIAE